MENKIKIEREEAKAWVSTSSGEAQPQPDRIVVISTLVIEYIPVKYTTLNSDVCSSGR